MELIILPSGIVNCLYEEVLDFRTLGQPLIRRASRVEPDEQGRWWADLSPVRGPELGPFERRSDALTAEAAWLFSHRLTQVDPFRKNQEIECGPSSR
jgi:hypothetical protein